MVFVYFFIFMRKVEGTLERRWKPQRVRAIELLTSSLSLGSEQKMGKRELIPVKIG